MNEIITGEKSRILRVKDDFVLFGTSMKPSEYVLYLSIIQLIQKRNTYNDMNESSIERYHYDITISELRGLFREKTYQKSQLKELIDNMLDNQSEVIIDNITISEKGICVEFDLHYYNKYFGYMKNYITVDINDFVGIKNINDINMMILFCKYSKSGWVKITEDNIRVLLNKDSINKNHLTRDIKSIINKFNDKYSIKNVDDEYWNGSGFKVTNGKNGLIYEFKFDSFKYIY